MESKEVYFRDSEIRQRATSKSQFVRKHQTEECAATHNPSGISDFDSIEPYDIWRASDDLSNTFEPIPFSDEQFQKFDSSNSNQSNSNLAVAVASNARKRKKKPNGMPKRPLSAYNLFFQAERAKILNGGVSPTEDCSVEDKLEMEAFQVLLDNKDQIETQTQNRRRAPHGKIGFADLGKCIGARWKNLSEYQKKKYRDLAHEESLRYKQEIQKFKSKTKEHDKKHPFQTEPTSKILDDKCSKRYKCDETSWYRQESPSTPRHTEDITFPPISTVVSSAHAGYQSRTPYSITIPDSNGVPKMYRFTYAAVPMSPRSAERYMASVTKDPAQHVPRF